MIRFLADEDWPAPATAALRAHGLEVISIQERSQGLPDLGVIALAQEFKAVILTFDRDYGDIIFKDRIPNPPAVVYFRAKGSTPIDAALRIIELIEQKTFDPTGRFTVISSAGVRERIY